MFTLKNEEIFVYIYSKYLSNFALRESRILIINLMGNLSTCRQNFERGGILKILQDSHSVFMARITTRAILCFHGLS